MTSKQLNMCPGNFECLTYRAIWIQTETTMSIFLFWYAEKSVEEIHFSL